MQTSTLRTMMCGATAVLFAPVLLGAQELPEARDLMNRYVEAIGGRDAVLAGFTARAVGEYTVPGVGVSGDFELVTAAPNKMLLTIDIPGMGTVRSGFDGTIGWSVDPFQGARVLAGDELTQTSDQSNALYAVRDPSLFTSVETVEQTEISGAPCYRVRLTWQSGRESFDCYDVETGLLVATEATSASPMASGKVTTTMEDYREVGEMRMPMRIVTEVMGAQQIITFSEVEFDGIDPSIFEPPAQIRSLVGSNP